MDKAMDAFRDATGCQITRRGWAWRTKAGHIYLWGWELKSTGPFKAGGLFSSGWCEQLIPLSRPMWQLPFERCGGWPWEVAFWLALAAFTVAAVNPR